MAKVLIVDDDETMVELLSTKLRTEGYEIFVANNGHLGLEECKKIKPDLIITDLMMPEMDGLDFILQVRKDDEEVPILGISGFPGKKEVAINLGATDFLEKPTSPKALMQKIRDLLSGNIPA